MTYFVGGATEFAGGALARKLRGQGREVRIAEGIAAKRPIPSQIDEESRVKNAIIKI